MKPWPAILISVIEFNRRLSCLQPTEALFSKSGVHRFHACLLSSASLPRRLSATSLSCFSPRLGFCRRRRRRRRRRFCRTKSFELVVEPFTYEPSLHFGSFILVQTKIDWRRKKWFSKRTIEREADERVRRVGDSVTKKDLERQNGGLKMAKAEKWSVKK